jgi:hypothetical protein
MTAIASHQHPRQMLFIFASIFGSSARISASPGIDGPGVAVPSMRLPRDAPVVEPARPALDPDPVEIAVPAVLVPGAVGFAELLAPPGLFAELLRPVVFGEPAGAPLTPAVPVLAPVLASGAPAIAEPVAVPAVPVAVLGLVVAPPVEVPVVGPAEPPAEPAAEPPADAPPPEPPPPLPPPLCANEASGLSNAPTITNLARNCFCIVCLRFDGQRGDRKLVPTTLSARIARSAFKLGFALRR